jgi:hypothetical protein
MDMPLRPYKEGDVFDGECKMIEARLWITLWRDHSNPAMREFANFMILFYGLDNEFEIDENRNAGKRILTSLQYLEVEKWQKYLERHSLSGLRLLAESILNGLDIEKSEN